MIRRLPALLLALLVAISAIVPSAAARDRDPLAPVHEMEATQFEAFPPEIIAPENGDAIVGLVNEAREFGVPVAVRVVSLPTDQEALSDFGDLDLTRPIPEDTVHEMARAWMDQEPIESSPGAGDGFLMLVVMPEDATLSSAVIEPGPNALPLNGLTEANINEVIRGLVLPRFANNEVSQGIRAGLSVFSYNNLFGTPERLRLNELHKDLQAMAGIPLAGLTTLSALALIALAAWIRSRNAAEASAEVAPDLSPFAASALARGRVDDAVVTGGLLELIRAGVLAWRPDRPNDLRIDRERAKNVQDPFLARVLAPLHANADGDGQVSRAAASRLHDLMSPARRSLEDDLARSGLFNRDARVELMWLILGSALVAAIALFTLLPSILGMARFGITAIAFAAVSIAGVLTWASRRSWTTARGRAALEQWPASAAPWERAAFDTVVNQDVLVMRAGGPTVPEPVTMIRALRGLGAT